MTLRPTLAALAPLLAAAPAAAQIVPIRLSAPAVTAAPAASTLAAAPTAAPALAASQALAAPSLSAAPALSAAPLAAAAAPAASPAAALPSLREGAAAFAAAPAAADGRAAAASAALFDGAAARAAADGPSAADAGEVSALNAAVADILRPFNGQAERASLTFSRVETNASRAVAVSLALDYAKRGPAGEAGLKVKDLSYSYPDAAGAKPETRAQGTVALNLLNVMTQAQIDQLGPQAQRLVADFVAEKTREYGPAAAVSARVTRQEAGAQGHLTALGLALDLDVDLGKLPAGKDAKDVLVTGLHVAADVTLKGVDFSVSVVSNPGARQFERDQTGLKEELDKLLARDAKSLARVGDLFRTLGRAADYATRGPRRAAALSRASFPSEDFSYPEPSAGLAAAKAASGREDAVLVSAGAHLDSKSQVWSYLFFSPSAKDFTKVYVDFRGAATLGERFPARDIVPAAPLELGRLLSLARAVEISRAHGLDPETASLERDVPGRAQWRFDGAGDRQLLVDAETGALLSRPIR